MRTLLAACSWLRLGTLPGLSQLLRRLKISLKRARQHVHSPDAYYVDKLHQVRVHVLRVPVALEQVVFLFEDEFTLYRQPTLATAYEAQGKDQPLAELGHKRNYTWRLIAALNAWTGQVLYEHARQMTIPRLVAFYQQVVQAYSAATMIYMAQDNWPVHFHPDVRAALQPQSWPWPLHLPGNWPIEPSAAAERLNLPLRLLPLPTYASWTNPIEKLWRLLHQEVLHVHCHGDDWTGLKQEVFAFLDQFAEGSADLLRYVGLSDPYKLYRSLFPT